MSRYSTIILSFGYGEADEREDDPYSRDCKPLRKVNAWLKKRKFDPLRDLAGGWLGMNVCMFANCYNHFDVDEFCAFVEGLKWHTIEDVRVQYWDEEAETFTLFEFPLSAERH